MLIARSPLFDAGVVWTPLFRIRRRDALAMLRRPPNRRQRGVERDRDARGLTCVRVHPVIEPAREDDEQPRFGPHAKRFSVRVARSGHSLRAATRIEKLQHAARAGDPDRPVPAST